MLMFIVGLAVSGITAFPLLAEMKLLVRFMGLEGATAAAGHEGMAFWILTVRFGLENIYRQYPWVGYGTDWLAFGHLVIALFFVATLFRPSESRPTLWVGIIACALVVPLALICGPIRGIPLYWRLIDCSFGVIGVLPLVYCLRLLRFMDDSPHRSATPPAG